MVQSKARNVAEYLAELPPDRRATIGAVRDVILARLPAGYEEGMQFGMISYSVPLSRYPDTYNGAPLTYAGLAAQKRAMSLYLTCVYADAEQAERFRAASQAAGKRLDMGKSCVRFRTLDDLPLEAIGDVIASTPVEAFIARYETSKRSTPKKRRPE